ncbi:MAG: hypothetical protein HQL90_10030 [Magnetococcales bacterium]|nr:hypothetical protein [Magnetococcales bacterium]
MRYLLLFVFLLGGYGSPLYSQAADSPATGEPSCQILNNKKLQSLDQLYQVDQFRIFYAARGRHLLTPANDVNGNQVPDSVENVGRQLVAARRLYEEVFQLRNPLQQPRYASAKHIDLFLLPMERGHGVAYDEPANYRLAADRGEESCSLRMDLKDNLEASNPSPAHELFHLYQYGYTLFKVGWFLEGMARWSEASFQKGKGYVARLPANASEIQRLFSVSYGAVRFWNPLARLLDSEGEPLPADLRGARYINGTAIFQQDRVYGVRFMRDVLEGLDQQDDVVSARNGFQKLFWKESDQRSPRNNPDLWKVILAVLKRYHREGTLPALP